MKHQQRLLRSAIRAIPDRWGQPSFGAELFLLTSTKAPPNLGTRYQAFYYFWLRFVCFERVNQNACLIKRFTHFVFLTVLPARARVVFLLDGIVLFWLRFVLALKTFDFTARPMFHILRFINQNARLKRNA